MALRSILAIHLFVDFLDHVSFFISTKIPLCLIWSHPLARQSLRAKLARSLPSSPVSLVFL